MPRFGHRTAASVMEASLFPRGSPPPRAAAAQSPVITPLFDQYVYNNVTDVSKARVDLVE